MKHQFALLLLSALLSKPILAIGGYANGNSIFEIFAEKDDVITDNDAFSSSPFFDRGPPPHQEAARMARYIVHNSDWTSMATISSRDPIRSFPFANVFSVSDGADLESSCGVPYLYLTQLEMSVKDLKEDPRASLTMSLAQGQYCDSGRLDPEDPRCAHVILTGSVTRLKANSTEESFAREALFSRHPEMPGWPKDHGWFFAKLDIASVLVLDFFGGAKDVKVEDYFAAKPF